MTLDLLVLYLLDGRGTRARGPISATSASMVSGPWELLIVTLSPEFAQSNAACAPILPAPMIPMFTALFSSLARELLLSGLGQLLELLRCEPDISRSDVLLQVLDR